MTWNQDIGMNMTLEFVTGCHKIFHVTGIAMLRKETGLTIIPTLNVMLGRPWKNKSGLSGHFPPPCEIVA